MTVSYTANVATVDQLSDHLRRCDDAYVPPLSERVRIEDYARKLAERATRLEAWNEGALIGLVAAYLPSGADAPVYISDVSVVPEQRGRHIASALLTECAALARHHAVDRLRLEVHRRNEPAIGLYEANGFHAIAEAEDILTMERPLNGSGLAR
jgi:ribosomal protein S18 acetylase RimI-like enzyme